jgi:hypothetical protein
MNEDTITKVSGDESIEIAGTIVATPTGTAPSVPRLPSKDDPFFAVPSLVISERQMKVSGDNAVLVSLTF